MLLTSLIIVYLTAKGAIELRDACLGDTIVQTPMIIFRSRLAHYMITLNRY